MTLAKQSQSAGTTEAVRRIYDLALARAARFILVAGDVLDREHLPRATMEEILTLLGDAPVPLVLIPGNHDPYRDGSAWARDEVLQHLRGFPQVHLCLEAAALQLPGIPATIYPCPVRTKNSPADLTAWIPSAERGGEWNALHLSHLNLLSPGDGPRAPPRRDLAGSVSPVSAGPRELTYEPVYDELPWPDPV